MDGALTQVARDGLTELLSALHGDNLTCYFYNPFSDIFWLFHTQGDFRFQCQMHGPLTHPAQRIRMECDLDKEDPGTGTTIFPNSRSSHLATRVLAEDSFATREQIASTVRIRVRRDANSETEPFVVIFVNYRGSERPVPSDANAVIVARLAWMRSCLLELAAQPRVEPAEAWRLRSMTLKFRQKLGQVLVSQPVADNQEVIYNYIVQQTRQLVRLRRGQNLLCTLSTVSNNNDVRVAASNPEGVTKASPEKEGIVEYVARTGRIYLIDDVHEYVKGGHGPSRPQYIPPCSLRSNAPILSELACPLIIQGKIVGVLNLEADQTNAYDDDHILLLYQFASAAAVAVRQIELFRDLNIALAQSRRLLSCANELEGSAALPNIYAAVLGATKELGYQGQIWDSVYKRWYQTETERHWPVPRERGFTRWVLEHGRPLVLTDLQKDRKDFGCRVGVLNDDLLFERWEESPELGIQPCEQVHALVREQSDVLCDFGFPISPSPKDPPTAVLWAKCNRYFVSLLTDESWCLSLFCRSASDALGVCRLLEHSRGSMALSRGTQCELVRYHFGGGPRGDGVQELLRVNPDALSLRKADAVIVLNVDLRNSTKFSAHCVREPEFSQYKDFLRSFHEIVREETISRAGVMDKTIGDGAQLLFNLYRPDVLDIAPHDDFLGAKERALDCAFAIERRLKQLITDTPITSFDMAMLCLGAGLTMGTAFVGGIGSELPGFEFSAYSFDTNHAGKLVSEARSLVVRDWTDRALEQGAKIFFCPPGSPRSARQLTDGDIRRLLGELRKESTSILFADDNFKDVRDHGYHLVPRMEEPRSGGIQVVYCLT